jgi:hypothetical protein
VQINAAQGVQDLHENLITKHLLELQISNLLHILLFLCTYPSSHNRYCCYPLILYFHKCAKKLTMELPEKYIVSVIFLLVSSLVLSYSLTTYFLCLNKVYSYFRFRPNFLPRITLANIWEPASRESCDNNIWEIVKTSFRILFGRSTLQVCGKLIPGCTCMVIVMKRRQCLC